VRWNLFLLSVLLQPTVLQAFQPPNMRDIASVETVLLLSSSSIGESLSRVTGYVIYLLHNTTQGDGIWFTKGQISRVSDSYRKWREENR